MHADLAVTLPRPLHIESHAPGRRTTPASLVSSRRLGRSVPSLSGPALYAELARRRRRAQIVARRVLDRAESRA